MAEFRSDESSEASALAPNWVATGAMIGGCSAITSVSRHSSKVLGVRGGDGSTGFCS